MIAGGWIDFDVFTSRIEVIPPVKNKNCTLPPLPDDIYQTSLIYTSETEEILLCGGKDKDNQDTKKCIQLKMKDNKWIHHSDLYDHQIWNGEGYPVTVSMPNGVYMFGRKHNAWEWLPRGSKTWILGNPNPPRIQGAVWTFDQGCAVKISNKELVLIGGRWKLKRVWRFNTENKEWTYFGGVLLESRRSHSCVVFKDLIIISGGKRETPPAWTTELIRIKDLTNFNESFKMKHGRSQHGLVLAHLQEQLSVLTIGGYSFGKNLDSIEMLNFRNGWAISEMKLSEGKNSFGYTTVPTSLVCQDFKTNTQTRETSFQLANPNSNHNRPSNQFSQKVKKDQEDRQRNWPKLAFGHYYLA